MDPELRILTHDEWDHAAPMVGPFKALAWHVRADPQKPGIIYAKAGFTSMERITHECMHELHGNNSIHHPWWHFCTLSAHPFRLRDHSTKPAREMASRLLSAV